MYECVCVCVCACVCVCVCVCMSVCDARNVMFTYYFLRFTCIFCMFIV